MPESSQVKDARRCSVECRAPPLSPFSQSSLPLHRNSHRLSTFCTEDNLQECLSHISQEVSLLGLSTSWTESDSGSQLNVVAVLNCMYDLIQLHHRSLRTLENMEIEQLKLSSNVDFLKISNTHLKEEVEVSKRQNTGLLERERQLQLKLKSLQNCLKNEKEEVQKLQNIISSRACQFNHEMKRREREFTKLKERLNQLLADKKDRKLAIDVLNNIGRADGKRSLWKTEKTEAKHEGEMYRTLLSDYDMRQRELVLENAELRKVMHQMKKEMVSILKSKKLIPNGEDYEHNDTQHNDTQHNDSQAASDEDDEVFDPSQESLELFCIDAREKLTNSIRLQWRRLKSHVETLDSQVSLTQMSESNNDDAAPRENHEEEMDRLKMEIQRCKDFIQKQQQLLQKQLSCVCNEDSVSLQNDGYMLQEKKRLGEEWKNLEEQRKSFERERRNFTEAAIRLSHERKIFEEDRGTWLKQQFLSMSPFGNTKQLHVPKSASALLIAESEVSAPVGPETVSEWQLDSASPIPRSVSLTSSSAADLECELCLIPENGVTCSSSKHRKSEHFEELSPLCENISLRDKQWREGEDLSSHSLTPEKSSSI
ncbi:afadin- and alpha-actinin-binding protein-like isoform X4 [Poeciliopsis prolifica]|nr:afadin- and alpha-actinin-binding protein-like isoform X4 [Poeciliopsis prolifica]XP_054901631.1 afadin- and alpha-actinin-binding protein-like isoform X4 [Poeciliopsis prolifica]XP_054901640.1 afadin- and alpha-actinin-binding protein-like isoform X4 [Poeciliopsis prolifica]XP_054901649.1 afadin- and alpha-actinin-binding protein-like isoform X4 [Poeciliopsis prolifica]